MSYPPPRLGQPASAITSEQKPPMALLEFRFKRSAHNAL